MGKKKTKKTNYKKLAIIKAKEVAKARDNYICQKCGRSRDQGWTQHGAHIMPVEWGGTAADPDNILCLCATCHSMGRTSAHEDPIGFARWFEENYPGKYDTLRHKALEYAKNPFPKIDWEDTLKTLRETLRRMTIE